MKKKSKYYLVYDVFNKKMCGAYLSKKGNRIYLTWVTCYKDGYIAYINGHPLAGMRRLHYSYNLIIK